MFDYSATVNPQRNSQILASQMHRNSLRIAPVSAIPPINSTQIHQKNLSDTWSNTNTGVHSKWSPPVSKLPPQEILHDRSSDIVASAFKNSVSDMLTLSRPVVCTARSTKARSKKQTELNRIGTNNWRCDVTRPMAR